MNRVFQVLKRTPILIVLILLIFSYMPTSLALSPETQRNTIVTALGIDKEGEEFSISYLCFVPQANSNYSEKYEVISTTGETVSESLEKASLIVGRNVNLNHMESIILADNVLEEDISHVLDYFARAPVVLTGVLVSATNGKAKDVIDIVNNLNQKTGVKIEDIFRYSDVNYHGTETTIDSFYSGYYSPTHTSLLGYVEVIDGEINGLSGAEATSSSQTSSPSGSSAEGSAGSSSQAQGNEGQTNSKVISNEGKLMLVKKGVKEGVLSLENIRGMNFTRSNDEKSLLTLDYPAFEGGFKKKVVYEVKKTDVFTRAGFENGVPKIQYKINLRLDLYEAIDDKQNEKETIEQYTISPETEGLIEKVVKKEFASALEIMKETKTDPLQIYELLQKKDRAKFKKYIETLESEDDFLSNVIFSISVDSKPF